MKMRVKYVKISGVWSYVLQVKKLIFWKTIKRFMTLKQVEEFLNTLEKVDDFNRRFGFESKPLSAKISIGIDQIRLLNKF